MLMSALINRKMSGCCHANVIQSMCLLTEGVSEMELDKAEQMLGLKLPLDLRCVYRIHNGQKFVLNSSQTPCPYGYLRCFFQL